MDSQTAYLILNLLPGIGPIKVKQLLSHVEKIEQIFTIPTNQLEKMPGIGPKLAYYLTHWSEFCNIEMELEALKLAKIDFVTQTDEDYPDALRELHDAPLLLYVAGNRKILNQKNCLAVVGSRFTTHYGEHNTSTITADAVNHGWIIVSGLARGIDTIAHRTACQFNGQTIAVIGSGLSQLYPPENIPLAKEIIEKNGAVISEFPLRTRPDKRTFPMRNRIISGLSAGTLVVEAGHNSGSLITAGTANEQGRLVFAVPGRIDSPQSKGCHELIRKGTATLIESFDDILEEFVLLPGIKSSNIVNQTNKDTDHPTVDLTRLALTDLEKTLLQRLYIEREVSIDSVMAWTDFPPGQVLAALISLEMKRLIKQLSGRRVTIIVDLS